MTRPGNPELLAQLRQELRDAQAEVGNAYVKLGTVLTRVNEAIRGIEIASEPFAPLPVNVAAYPAGKRQALFYIALFRAGGEPDGEFVREEDIASQLATLTLEGKPAPSLATLRERFMSRRGVEFELLEPQRLYRLLSPALIAMRAHLDKVGGIPADISVKIRE